jgi:hypothetical protein
VNERRTSVPSEAAQLPVLARFLQEFWSAADLPPAQSLAFEIALEEIFMNVVTHGTSPGGEGRWLSKMKVRRSIRSPCLHRTPARASKSATWAALGCTSCAS